MCTIHNQVLQGRTVIKQIMVKNISKVILPSMLVVLKLHTCRR